MTELMLENWWAWVAFALLLAILEVSVPGFVFLGFAIGAAVVGALIAWSPVFADAITSNLSALLVFFAVLSLISWIVMRQMFGGRGAQVKTFDTDIND